MRRSLGGFLALLVTALLWAPAAHADTTTPPPTTPGPTPTTPGPTPTTPVPAAPALPTAAKFWLTDTSGDVWSFGGALFRGSLGGVPLHQPIVTSVASATGGGYWMASADGGVFAFGDAGFHGSLGDIVLNRPIVTMAPTKTGGGYWLVSDDGGVFAFGDARFFGSTGGIKLAKPIVGMAPTPSGNGYWLVASDGGVFSFGDAAFYGSTGAIKLVQPIAAMTPAPQGGGYWLVAADGGVFSFGTAAFHGSDASSSPESAQRIVASRSGAGYWIVRENGEVAAFGDATGAPPAQAVLLTPSTPGDTAVLWAFTQLGKPYIYGGNGPAGYDCSGLVLASWRTTGASFARVANDQYHTTGDPVAMTDLRAGDLVFWGNDLNDWTTVYHSAMYVGGGQIVESTGDHVQLNTLRQWGTRTLMLNGRRP